MIPRRLRLVLLALGLAVPASDAAARGGVEILRVMGGEPAPPGAFSSAVAVHIAIPSPGGGRYRCGGTVIGRDWVLTAGHCVAEPGAAGGPRPVAPERIQVTEGTTDLSSGRGQQIAVAQVLLHPDYAVLADPGSPTVPANDVALVRLAEPSRQPRQLLLAGEGRAVAEQPGRMATVIGFGDTGAGRASNLLLQVDLPLVSRAECRQDGMRRGRPATAFGDFMLCAGQNEGSRDSCKGDSGGPLFVRGLLGDLVQIGVVSWGPNCRPGRWEGYGAYAAVARFEGWIRQQVRDADFAVAEARPAGPTDDASLLSRPAPDVIPSPAPSPGPAVPEQYLGATAVPPDVPPAQAGQVAVDIVQGNRLALGSRAVLRVTSSIAGQLVLVVIDPAGKLVQVFPNRLMAGFAPGQANGLIRAGQTMLVPGPADRFALTVSPPLGMGRVIAIVLPPGPGVARQIGRALDLEPVADSGGWLAGLGAVAAAARGGATLPTMLGIGSRHFEVVDSR